MKPPYNVERTSPEVVLCIAILAVYLYKVSRLPTPADESMSAVFTHRRMVVCQRIARWFGEQAITAEHQYHTMVGG